jgi:competence ComEA-like helix-hairpin-helix protein
MLNLTYHERRVLILIGVLLLVGAFIKVWNVTFFKQSVSGVSQERLQAPVNINDASRDELTALPYIGETRASLIIEYRLKHGEIKTPEELLEIKGIGPKILDEIKDHIVF